MLRILLAAALAAVFTRADAAVLYRQAPDPNGGSYHSSWWDPDGSNYDEYVWDKFVLTSGADIDSIRWRGGYDPAYGGDTPVVNFWVGVYASIPGGSEPDVAHPPLFEYETGDNAHETYAGTFGGRAMYDYRFTLPVSFHALAGVPYWVQIEAWQHGFPGWSIAKGTAGDGSHFRCQHLTGLADVPTGCYFTRPSGDAAFSLHTEALIGVPQAQDLIELILTGPEPNPTRSDRVMVSIFVPGSTAAELALFDAGGRRVTSQVVPASLSGPRFVDATAGTPLGPGVYFARLSQGATSRVVRMVVVP